MLGKSILFVLAIGVYLVVSMPQDKFPTRYVSKYQKFKLWILVNFLKRRKFVKIKADPKHWNIQSGNSTLSQVNAVAPIRVKRNACRKQ